MARPATGRPTDFELEILKVLWTQGPSTVREVMEEMSRSRAVGYTTALKMLQIMDEKGLVACDKRERIHVYRARQSYRSVAKRLAGDLLERVYEGSAHQLMLHALENKKLKPEELGELRKLLDEIERRGT